jgi:1,4-alpha-glucan branching enzyme
MHPSTIPPHTARHRSLPHVPRVKPVKPVNFICTITTAKHVALIGDFNGWQPASTPMTRQPDGCWLVQLPLSVGHHHYLFLVDGKPMLDPRASGVARNEKGEKVSLLSVGH